jgi:hypothetical protein
MELRIFLSDLRQVLSELKLVSDKWYEEVHSAEPEASIFDSVKQFGHINTVSCEPRPCPEMSKLWERTLKIGADNGQ